jgi:hypothetical protein
MDGLDNVLHQEMNWIIVIDDHLKNLDQEKKQFFLKNH